MTAPSHEVEGLLRRRAGQPCPPVTFTGRPLGDADLASVIALHHKVRAMMPPALLAAESDAFFADHMNRIGRIFGLFAEGAMIAYGVLGLPGPGNPNFGDDIGLSAEAKAGVAHIDGSSVDPEWWGNRLQRVLVAWRLREATAAGRSLALCTVAPGNAASLSNTLAEGLSIHALLKKFGGWRYMMGRDLKAPPPVPPANGQWIDGSDLDAQGRLLAAGSRGWRMERRDGGYRLWFAPPP